MSHNSAPRNSERDVQLSASPTPDEWVEGCGLSARSRTLSIGFGRGLMRSKADSGGFATHQRETKTDWVLGAFGAQINKLDPFVGSWRGWHNPGARFRAAEFPTVVEDRLEQKSANSNSKPLIVNCSCFKLRYWIWGRFPVTMSVLYLRICRIRSMWAKATPYVRLVRCPEMGLQSPSRIQSHSMFQEVAWNRLRLRWIQSPSMLQEVAWNRLRLRFNLSRVLGL